MFLWSKILISHLKLSWRLFVFVFFWNTAFLGSHCVQIYLICQDINQPPSNLFLFCIITKGSGGFILCHIIYCSQIIFNFQEIFPKNQKRQIMHHTIASTEKKKIMCELICPPNKGMHHDNMHCFFVVANEIYRPLLSLVKALQRAHHLYSYYWCKILSKRIF